MSLFKKMLEKSIATLTNPTKMLGSAGIKRRAGLFASYMGAGYGFSAAMDRQIEHSRNYYGAENFEREYGEGVNMPGNIGKYYVGWLMGGMSLIDRDYISRGRNTYRYLFGEGNKYRKLLNSKKLYNRTIPYDGHFEAQVKMGKHPGVNVIRQPHEGTMLVQEPFNISPVTAKTRNRLEQSLKKFKDAPQFGLLQMISSSSILGGATSLSSGLMNAVSSPAAQYTLYGTTAATLLMGGVALHSKGKLTTTMIGLGVVGAGGYAGLKAGKRPYGGAAEGTITDFSDYNNSAVRRMNFSTAGLVQALDRNNRRY